MAAAAVAAALVGAACGGSDSGDGSGDASIGEEAESAPSVVATTDIWADVVANIAACDDSTAVRVSALIPPGVEPHGYAPSLADRARLAEASLVLSNGLDLEEGLEDVLDSAARDGTPVFAIGDHVDTIPYSSDTRHADEGEEAHEDHEGEEGEEAHEDHEGEDGEEAHEDHEGEEGEEAHEDHEGEDGEEAHEDHEGEDGHEGHDHEGEEAHAHSGADPHIWFDPVRVSQALPELADRLVADVGLDRDDVEACLADYQAELAAADADIAAVLAAVPESDRKLVTNHDSLGYFAARYGFEVIGTVLPVPSGLAEATPGHLAELAELIDSAGVKAIFAEQQHSDRDIRALAERLGGVQVVTLFTGALGEPGSGADTYTGFLRRNAELVADALR